MDKGLLFQFMRVKFREAGFPQAEVELHMQSFTERYQNQTDEEIEADIRRRGGPTRIAAATVERRNTVLMADADYRAFVMTAKEKEAENQNAKETAADVLPVKETAADVPVAEEMTAEETEPETVTLTEDTAVSAAEQTETVPAVDDAAQAPAASVAEDRDDDPLAAWLTISDDKPSKPENTDAQEDITALFSEPEQNAAAEDALAVTAEIPQVTPAQKQPQQQTGTPAPADASVSKPRPAPQRAPITPRPVGDADMGSTKILQVPGGAPIGGPQNADAQNAASPKKPPQSKESYQKEQAAIWGASSADVRDGKNGAPQQAQRKAPAQKSAAPNRPAAQKPAAKPAEKKKEVEYADRGTVTRLQEKTYWGEGSEEGVKRFRIIMAVSMPFVVILLLAYAILALGLIAAMAVLIAAFILGLVAEVAVGSLVALVAVIYGVSQTFLVLPVGLFELGLGIAAIGVTMFVGILMYNIAVRLLPFLLKSFIAFQSVFKGFLQDLYYYVKGECYRR